MWRLSYLFNSLRGGARSGGWRVREPPSQLLNNDREDQQPAAAGRQWAPSRALLIQPRSSGQLVRQAHAAATRISPYITFIPNTAGAPTAVAVAPRLVPEPKPRQEAEPEPELEPAAAASESEFEPEPEPEPADPLTPLRVAFAGEHDRLMADVQNAAGAGLAGLRPRQALQCFREAATLGSAAAWFNAGVCFQQGIGTVADLQKAAACFEEATLLEHPAAAYNLALLVAAGSARSRWDVATLLERAAAAGCAKAAEFLPTWRQWYDADEDEDDVAPPGEVFPPRAPAQWEESAGARFWEFVPFLGDTSSMCECETTPHVGQDVCHRTVGQSCR